MKVLFLALFFAQNTFAIEILSHGKIKELLGDYPQKGSIEEVQDFEDILNLQKNRTESDCAEAASEESVSLKTLFGRDNGPLTVEEVKKLSTEFFLIKAIVAANSLKAKNFYKRLRPYHYHAEVIPCISKPEPSYAYPSGHAATAYTYALVLSHKFPERTEAFLIRASEVAHNRVLGGVHHPTDIRAGKILGEYFAQKFIK